METGQSRVTRAGSSPAVWAAFSGARGFGDLLGGLSTGGILSGGLGDLLKTFQQNVHGEKADSWVKPGTNADIDDDQLGEALGPDILNESQQRAGCRKRKSSAD